jgi:hypothetical protein
MKMKVIRVSWLGRLQSVQTAFRKYTHWKRVAEFFKSYPGHPKEAEKKWLEDHALSPTKEVEGGLSEPLTRSDAKKEKTTDFPDPLRS